MTTRLDREQAIAKLRTLFLELVDDEHSMCDVARCLNIYCHGFAQHTFEELKERYDWLVARRRGITREELEKLANIWQVARQEVQDTELSCDTQTIEHDTCRGWDGWEDADLQRFLHELGATDVEVVSTIPGTASTNQD